VGTSDTSWEGAVKTAVETTGESIRDLRIAEITKLDVTIENGKIASYRARTNVSFKFHKKE
jgi:flavin-binding protein dodecin